MPCRGGAEQTQPELLLGLLAELLDQCQTPAHPARGPAQKLRHLHLGKLVLSHQGKDDPGLLELAGPAAGAVESQHRYLGALLVGLEHPRGQPRPLTCFAQSGPPLKAIDQLVVPGTHEDHDRRDLPVAPQRCHHQPLGLRLVQAKAAETVPDLIEIEADHSCVARHDLSPKTKTASRARIR